MAVSAGRIESPTPYDHLTTEKGVSKDRVFALDIAQLKDTLADQCKEDEPTRNAVLKWFPGPRNVSDGLTKYIPVQDSRCYACRVS